MRCLRLLKGSINTNKEGKTGRLGHNMERPPLDVDDIEKKVSKLREDLVEITYETGGAYLAQALSGIDLMASLLYRYVRCDPNNPAWDERDRFLLSPGHYALALYVILADLGYFSKELLFHFKENGSPVELISHRGTLPGVEVSGGSLGQVLSLGVGMALSARIRGQNHRVFVMMSDGEQDEGQIWEALASASHFRCSNLIAVVDCNGFQVDGPTKEVMNMEPLADKYRSFGWEVLECNGNSVPQVVSSLEILCNSNSEKPKILIGRTVRGYGVSFMEGNPSFHYARLDNKQKEVAIRELCGDSDAV